MTAYSGTSLSLNTTQALYNIWQVSETSHQNQTNEVLYKFSVNLLVNPLHGSGNVSGHCVCMYIINFDKFGQIHTVLCNNIGCSFLTEQCTNKSVYPYLCDPNENLVMCTFDHLSKVCMYMHKCLLISVAIKVVISYVFCTFREFVQLIGDIFMAVLLL